MRKAMRTILVTVVVLAIPAPALACGGLIAPNGAIGLVKTSTLSAYVDGEEHYVTQFEFAGAEGEFGSIVPLPGEPSDVRQAGRWTLQRLAREVQPEVLTLSDGAAVAEAVRFKVLEQKRIGALDITILRGGGRSVGRWAVDNGFSLTPDAPAVLDFYARRSPFFMAAKFDATAAARRGLTSSQGTAIHLTIPTDAPWVPLRILALGQSGGATVKADVFLLTEQEPTLLPAPAGSQSGVTSDGLLLSRSEEASRSLLFDLQSDRGMRWLPTDGMWLSYLRLREEAQDLTYDLAVDASGREAPSPVDAGLGSLSVTPPTVPGWVPGAVLGAAIALALAAVALSRRTARPA
jgi:Uncharacterized protein conserved in bacteria (DUF2330)